MTPDEKGLPAGWTVQFHALKTGRKIKCFVNCGTGQRFFSKYYVFRHLKRQRKEFDQLQEIEDKRLLINSPMHLVENTDEHPEWLPRSWVVEWKTRKSGPHSGSRYKCYIDPSTGCCFQSKPDVFRYLKTMKHKSCTLQKETSQTIISVHQGGRKVTIEKSTVEDLPPGWIKELKITENANGIRRDPYFTDPVSGYVFRSKLDVLRYLETGDISRNAFLPKKRRIDGEILPPEAAKSQSLKHPAARQQLLADQGKGSSDVSSTEVSYPMEKHNSSESGMRSSKRKTQNHTGKSNEKKWLNLPRRSSKRLVGLEPEPVADTVSRVHIGQNVRRSRRNLANQALALTTDCLAGKTSPPREAKSIMESQWHAFTHAKKLLLDKPSDKSQKSLDDQAVTKEQSQELETDKTQDEKSEPGLIPPHGELRTNQFPEYASKNPAAAIPMENCVFPAADIMAENNLLASRMGQIDNSNNVERSKNRKKLNLPRRFSKRLAKLEPELVVNSMSRKEAFETGVRFCKGEAAQQLEAEPRMELLNGFTNFNTPSYDKLSNSGQKPLHDQDLCKDQSQELGTGKYTDEKSESGHISPHGVFDTDPGPEYSCETLAGTILVENDLVAAANIMDENNLLVSRLGKMDNEKNVNRSKSRKEVNLPRRSSKRLSRLEPELMANSVSSKEAYDDVSRFYESKTSQQLEAEPRAEPLHGSVDVYKSSQGKPSTKCKKPIQDQALPKEQLQELKTDNSLNEKSESDLIPPREEFWTNACQDYSCKSLSGEIAVENDSIPAADIMYENNVLVSGMEQTDNEKNVKKSKCRKNLNLARRSAKRLAGLQSELVADSVSSKEAYEIVVRFCNREPAQQIEDETRTEPIYRLSDAHRSRHGKPSINSLHDEALYKEQSQELETDKTVDETSESDLIPPHGEFWKHPCPEHSCKSLPVAKSEPVENDIIFAANIMDENNLLGSRMGRTDNKKNVKRSKSRKVLNLSCRSAKRLAQLEPELRADSVSSKEAYEIVVRFCKSEASHQLEAEARTEPLNNSADANNSAQEKPSNNSQKPLHDQALPKAEPQELETDKTIDDKSEPRLIPLFGEFLSDPCLEFAVNTLTGAMPVENAADNGLVSAPAADIMKEKDLPMNLIEKRGNKKNINPGNRKELNLPGRSLKELAERESDIATNSVSNARSLTTSSCESMGIQAASNGVPDEASQQLEPGEELLHHASAGTNYLFHGEPSNKRQKHLPVSSEQLQELETDKTNVGKSEQQLIPPFSEFLSDPCLEFAFKTLTGAISVENAADKGLVSTPDVDIVGEKNPMVNSRENSENKASWINSSKSKSRKELKLAYQSSRRLAGLELKSTTNSLSRKSSKNEAILDVGLAQGSLADRPQQQQQQLEPTAEHHSFMDVFPDVSLTVLEEPSNERDEPSVAIINETPSQKPEFERIYVDKPELQPFFSVEDYWSDPCLEFAVKTLTGAIPVEDSFGTPSYFQPPVNLYQTQREGYLQQLCETSQRDDYLQPQNISTYSQKDGSLSLPDYGLPSFFHTDISVHFDGSEKQLASQPQITLNNPSFLPSGNVSLQTCSSIGSQQPHFEGNKGLSGKVKS